MVKSSLISETTGPSGATAGRIAGGLAKKYFLMDEADGLHHSFRVFNVDSVNYSSASGLCSAVEYVVNQIA